MSPKVCLDCSQKCQKCRQWECGPDANQARADGGGSRSEAVSHPQSWVPFSFSAFLKGGGRAPSWAHGTTWGSWPHRV